jgi:hypothetical protein
MCGIKGQKFGFDTDDLLISTDQDCCHCQFNFAEFKYDSIAAVEKLKANHVTCTRVLNFNSPGLLDRLWYSLLHSAIVSGVRLCLRIIGGR